MILLLVRYYDDFNGVINNKTSEPIYTNLEEKIKLIIRMRNLPKCDEGSQTKTILDIIQMPLKKINGIRKNSVDV